MVKPLNLGFGKKIGQSLSIMTLRGLSMVAKFGLTLFIARFIGLKALGLYGLIVGASSIVPVILGFGLINTLSRLAVTKPQFELTSDLLHYFVFFSLIYLFSSLFIFVVIYYTGNIFQYILIYFVIMLEHINGDIFTLLNNLSKPVLSNFLYFVRSAFWIFAYVALAILFPVFRTIECVLVAWIIGNILGSAIFGYFARNWHWTWDVSWVSGKHWAISQIRGAVILYINDIANTVSQFLDRYLISIFLGLKLTGVYVLFWSIGNALSNLIRFGPVAIMRPKLIGIHKNRGTNFWSVYRVSLLEVVGTSVFLAIVAWISLRIFLPYIRQPAVSQWFPIFALVLGGFIARMIYEAQGAAFYSQHRDDFTLITGLYVLAAIAILDMLFVPFFGLPGAGWAVMLAGLIGCVARQLYIYRLAKTGPA